MASGGSAAAPTEQGDLVSGTLVAGCTGHDAPESNAAGDGAFDRTMAYALSAMQRIEALRLPADPPSFHF
jgi:hypothetical protein